MPFCRSQSDLKFSDGGIVPEHDHRERHASSTTILSITMLRRLPVPVGSRLLDLKLADRGFCNFDVAIVEEHRRVLVIHTAIGEEDVGVRCKGVELGRTER